MRSYAIAVCLLLPPSLLAAACPDPRLRSAQIGGDTINAVAMKAGRPLKGVPVRLYNGIGRLLWSGVTGNGGGFKISYLLPDMYRLEVEQWGSTDIEIDPKLDGEFQYAYVPFRFEPQFDPKFFQRPYWSLYLLAGQTPSWSVLLLDGGCVGVGQTMD
jgi:hypothetical protein